MSGVVFRDATPSDDGAIVALWKTCGLTRPWNDPFADIAFARAQPHAAVLVGGDGGDRILASVMVGHDGHRGWVYYLAADPASRRRGLGRAAMVAAENWLKSRGIWKLNVVVRNDNADVAGFYRAIGYGDDQCRVLSRRLDGRGHREPFPDASKWA